MRLGSVRTVEVDANGDFEMENDEEVVGIATIDGCLCVYLVRAVTLLDARAVR